MTVMLEKNDCSLIISLNRPAQRNALNSDTIHALHNVLEEQHKNKAIRSIILKGEGDHFCAGADIKEMEKLYQQSHQENLKDANNLANLFWQLYTFPKPVICLAHGVTLGGGIGLLAASDIAIAEENATFAFSEVKLGILPAVISPYVFRAIGRRAARRYFLTGERFSANNALTIGLVHQVVPGSTLLETGLSFANTIAQNAPTAVSLAKELILKSETEVFDLNYALSLAEELAAIRQTKEAKEGFQAFIEKRSAKWSTT